MSLGFKRLSSLRWNEHVTLRSKEPKFDAASVNILSYRCEIWAVGYRLRKNLLSTEMGFGKEMKKSKMLNVESN